MISWASNLKVYNIRIIIYWQWLLIYERVCSNLIIKFIPCFDFQDRCLLYVLISRICSGWDLSSTSLIIDHSHFRGLKLSCFSTSISNFVGIIYFFVTAFLHGLACSLLIKLICFTSIISSFIYCSSNLWSSYCLHLCLRYPYQMNSFLYYLLSLSNLIFISLIGYDLL